MYGMYISITIEGPKHFGIKLRLCCGVAMSPPHLSPCCPVDRVLSVLMLAVVKGEAEAVTKLLCSSHLGLDRVYTSLEMAQRYTTALAAARRPTMPSSVTVRERLWPHPTWWWL